MSTAELALLLSGISVVIALTSVGWNIFKELFLRPRSKMSGGVYFIQEGDIESESYVNIQITNLGPGKINIKSIVLKESGPFKRLFGRERRAIIMYDYENKYNPRMPMLVEHYDSAAQMLPIRTSDFLEGPVTHLGFLDNLGRYHWISKRDLRSLKKSYREHKEKGFKP